MCEISVADGFFEINENLGDMIKYIANEPSVGLYYIQQHAQNAVPNVVRLNKNLVDKSNEVSFHTEDLEDSVAMLRTMKKCGSPIIDEMIRDIKTSLALVSSKPSVRGVVSQRSSEIVKPGSYFSSVFKSAKEKAVNFTWPQQDSEPQLLLSGSNSSVHADKLALSSQVENEILEECNVSADNNSQQLLSEEAEFDEFRAERKTLLEDWLTSSRSVLPSKSVS
ncbi:hypothetical protein KSS87_008192 [Heliosperma pusillum]|nr:hypothetical protein KSS87_008192 [Heliosperma pusillum]